MKRTVPLIILLLLFVTFAFAQSKIAKSTIKFQLKNLGIKTGGSIDGLQANIAFDPAALNTSSIAASLDVSTINTDNDLRDKHLRSDEFFDVPHYPKITMKSIALKHKSGNNYTGQFNLTIKDKTHLVDVPFTYTDNGTTATITGSFKINRLDYSVGGSSLVMSNDVTISIEVEMAK